MNIPWRKVAAVVAVIVMIIVVLRFGKSNMIEIRDRFGWAAPLISVPLQAVLAASPFPSDLICIGNGAVYGYILGVVYSYIGWYLGSILQFAVVRGMIPDEVSPQWKEKIPGWMRRFPVGSPIFLIIGRQIPFYGGDITIVSASVAGVSWFRFLWCTAIAVIPGSLLYPAIGAKLL